MQFVPLLDSFREDHQNIPVLIDTDAGDDDGPFNQAIREGLEFDRQHGDRGWAGLESQAPNEDGMLALPYTSDTTSRPKGVVYTHRSAYLAGMGNIVESQLNQSPNRCGYLWVLPMFHAIGWKFPWAIIAMRGTHYCLRKVDYPYLWHLLRTEPITHFCAAPTVNTLFCCAKEAVRLARPVRVTVSTSPPSAVLFEQMTCLNLHPVHAYGLTETYGPVSMAYHLPEWNALPATEKWLPVRVIKPDRGSELIDVAKDALEIGEIIL